MALKLYNTLTRKKEEFKPIHPPNVGLYACGPTVYWYQHIGNMRTYIFEDILRRVLARNNFKVKHVVNVTDVGHLTSDADEGEDKLMKAIKREGLPLTRDSMLQLADKYFDEFKKDFDRLNLLHPDIWCKATEHVQEMIDMVKKIEKNGYAYKTSVGLTFDTKKFKDYAKLARLKLDELEAGARGKKDTERRSPSDFALWVTNQPNHIMQWDSPWGKGFPGWHIECCAMGTKYLGEQFDIHCGGREHIPLHHTNEIAQAEAATGKKPWVKYWIHAEWLVIPKGKMSKSKGSFTTVADLIEQNISPLAFKYLTFSTHYRKPLTFTWEALEGAVSAYKTLKNRVAEIKKQDTSFDKDNKKDYYKKEFMKKINDDLNMPQALALMNDLLKDDKLGSKEKTELIADFDEIFALDLLKEEKVDIPKEIQDLVDKREQARKNKDWKTADKLREEIIKKGFVLEDTKEGSVVKKK
ncbi:cysteine--tRNA ligase [Candidatus Woesearchaeota archaeon]|nr:cysteine--tRNA ligase [Candidatus Woesearchaeota archaeon]